MADLAVLAVHAEEDRHEHREDRGRRHERRERVGNDVRDRDDLPLIALGIFEVMFGTFCNDVRIFRVKERIFFSSVITSSTLVESATKKPEASNETLLILTLVLPMIRTRT